MPALLYAILWLLLKALLLCTTLLFVGIGLMWLGFSLVHNWNGGRRG